ncbi:hypothetical protein ACPCA8_25640 [Streptomyces capoamus]|uniref:hypothetical protein n=1 Tax=Streptomyces capoamus TaxID=68183 RepID=UPI003C2DA81C
MTPRLRRTRRCLRLLVVLTATALPAYGTAVAYGSAGAYGTAVAYGSSAVPAAEQGSARPSATDHRGGQRLAEGAGRTAVRYPAAGRGHPEQGPPGHGGPAAARATPAPSAHQEAPAVAPLPSDSASASVRPYRPLASVEPSRAGSRAGEGRMRPGRLDGPATEVEGDDDPPPPTPVAQPQEQEEQVEQAEPEEAETARIPSASPTPEEAGSAPAGHPERPAQQAAQQGQAPVEPVLRLLPLGSGLVLIGLGLGLALLGLRLRRS